MRFLATQAKVPVFATVDLRGATITIGSTEIAVGQGTFSWSEAREMEFILDRGSLDEVRRGDDQPMEVSFEFTWKYTTYGTIEDAVKGTAFGSSESYCDPFKTDITVALDDSCGGSGVETTFTISDFYWESWDANINDGTVSCSGRCNSVTPARS